MSQELTRIIEVTGSEFIQDDEMFAIMAVFKAIEPLETRAKIRVLGYVSDFTNHIGERS